MTSPEVANGNHLPAFDNEIFALTLQLQEIEAQRDNQPRKYPEDSPPDFAVAFLDFEAELKRALTLVEDLRIAHSIAQAVDADALLLGAIRAGERQADQDRNIALRLDGDNEEININAIVAEHESSGPGTEAPPPYEAFDLNLTDNPQSDNGDEAMAGPSESVPYALHQKDAYEQLSLRKIVCEACTDKFWQHETIRLARSHTYCKECLKSLFLRTTRDESLFPPRCCRSHVPLSLVLDEFTSEETCAYALAEVEFSTKNRVYYARSSCGKFIPPEEVLLDNAWCSNGDFQTCVHCKNAAHDGECQEDQALQAVVQLAEGRGWRRCFGCNAMIELKRGCNHIT